MYQLRYTIHMLCISSIKLAKINRALRKSRLQLCYLGSFLLLWCGATVVWDADYTTVVNNAIGAIHEYGTIIVVIGAAVEGIVIVNLYFPGSIMVAAAIISARNNPALATWYALVCFIAFCLSAIINYAIGRLGFAPLLASVPSYFTPVNSTRWTRSWHFILSMHPNFAAFQQVEAGVTNVSFRTIAPRVFLGYLTGVTVCACLVYRFSSQVMATAGNPYLITAILSSWAIWVFVREYNEDDGLKNLPPN